MSHTDPLVLGVLFMMYFIEGVLSTIAIIALNRYLKDNKRILNNNHKSKTKVK